MLDNDAYASPAPVMAKGLSAEQTLKSAIVHGVLKPGEILSEARLCDEFAIGRGAVRTALQRLQSSGLVTSAARSGWSVTPISAAEIREVVAGRRALEKMLASVPISEADQTQIGRLCDMYGALYGRSDPMLDLQATMRRAERDLLLLLAVRLNMPTLSGWLMDLWDRSARLINFFEARSSVKMRGADRAASAHASWRATAKALNGTSPRPSTSWKPIWRPASWNPPPCWMRQRRGGAMPPSRRLPVQTTSPIRIRQGRMTMPVSRRLSPALLMAAALSSVAFLAMPAAAKDLFVVDLVNEPSSLDPQKQWNPDSYYVYRNVFDNLLTRDNDGKIVPQIATKWDYKSPTEIVFTLRGDVKFHDGQPLTAEDVAFSINRIIDPAFKSPQFSQFNKIKSAAVSGENEVTVVTDGPYPCCSPSS